jgi:hypothetical protein
MTRMQIFEVKISYGYFVLLFWSYTYTCCFQTKRNDYVARNRSSYAIVSVVLWRHLLFIGQRLERSDKPLAGYKICLSFLVWHILPTRLRCGGLLLHPITLNDTYALGKTPLDEGSACRRDIYITTHNIHNRQTSMPSAKFEPAIPVTKRPQTHVLDQN